MVYYIYRDKLTLRRARQDDARPYSGSSSMTAHTRHPTRDFNAAAAASIANIDNVKVIFPCSRAPAWLHLYPFDLMRDFILCWSWHRPEGSPVFLKRFGGQVTMAVLS